MEAHSKAKFEILKCEPKICDLVQDIIKNKLDANLFPFIGERPVPKRSLDEVLRGSVLRGGKGKIQSDMLNKPKVFVFVAGGLSHHEIVSLERLQNSFDTRIVPGSD